MVERTYEVPDYAEEAHPLLIGAEIPALTAIDSNGDPFDLNVAIAEKPTILFFYRGNW